jgi:hypothetical protein
VRSGPTLADRIAVTSPLPWLLVALREALAAHPSPAARDVQVDDTESDAPRLVVVRDDSGPTGRYTASRSIGIRCYAGTPELRQDARDLAALVLDILPTFVQPGPESPVADVRDRRGPFDVDERTERACAYVTAELITV